MMTRNTEHRLGCRDGLRDLQNHPWFAGLDWIGLESKETHVPFVPDVSGFPKLKIPPRTEGLSYQLHIGGLRSWAFFFMCFEESRSSEADGVHFAVQEGKL